ncbi:MAG: hypothetical protein L0H96_10595 [Humibacillus sp.]|nr:hypothetical protein [Humibacillus sp.]MDN5777348.1 hypothetical protein [Humibacillus sp.]
MTARLPLGRNEIYLLPALSEAEAARVAAAVLDPPPELRRACWHVSESIGTIGEPLYRNRDRPDYYRDRARATNRMLAAAYATLYDRVVALFEERYQVPVVFVEELAIPGFHLVSYSSAGWHDGGGWHTDQLAWQVPYFCARAAEVDGVVNFTLPLIVPSGGTGMDLVDDIVGAADQVAVHVPYQPGVMVLSECEILHRLGPSTSTNAGELRLTHQGHGVLFRGRLLLFW